MCSIHQRTGRQQGITIIRGEKRLAKGSILLVPVSGDPLQLPKSIEL